MIVSYGVKIMHNYLPIATCPLLFLSSCKSLVNLRGATPVDHTTSPQGIVWPLLSLTSVAVTSAYMMLIKEQKQP